MPDVFYRLLKPLVWPRYREEGPPTYIDTSFFGMDFRDSDGKIREPLKSILGLIIVGYRPVTSLSILSILIENENRPMYGSQIGAQLESKFELPKGWFTKTRYYDTRVGKLLKVLLREDVLEEMKVKDWKTNKEYVGYRIADRIYPVIKDKLEPLHQGIGILTPSVLKQKRIGEDGVGQTKNCPKCGIFTNSTQARYCEVCGNPLSIPCAKCGSRMSLEYSYCLNCGKRFE